MLRVFLAQCHRGVCSGIFERPLPNIKLDRHIVPTVIFFFRISDHFRNAYAKKTADEIPSEGNCRLFLQGASV